MMLGNIWTIQIDPLLVLKDDSVSVSAIFELLTAPCKPCRVLALRDFGSGLHFLLDRMRRSLEHALNGHLSHLWCHGIGGGS